MSAPRDMSCCVIMPVLCRPPTNAHDHTLTCGVLPSRTKGQQRGHADRDRDEEEADAGAGVVRVLGAGCSLRAPPAGHICVICVSGGGRGAGVCAGGGGPAFHEGQAGLDLGQAGLERRGLHVCGLDLELSALEKPRRLAV